MRILLTKPSTSRPGSTVGSPRIRPTGLSSTLCCLTFSVPSGKKMSLIIESSELIMTRFETRAPSLVGRPASPCLSDLSVFFFSACSFHFSVFLLFHESLLEWLILARTNTHSIQHTCIKWSFSFPCISTQQSTVLYTISNL